MEYIWAYIIAAVVWGSIWGIVTNTVISNKGYSENWFWWGFFFGFIAFIVALTKPDLNWNYRHYKTNSRVLSNAEEYEETSRNALPRQRNQLDGYWKCTCKNYNSSNSDVCSVCGSKRDYKLAPVTYAEQQIKEEQKNAQNENIDILKKYKELLDMGAITEEEYDKKKKELLNIQ